MKVNTKPCYVSFSYSYYEKIIFVSIANYIN